MEDNEEKKNDMENTSAESEVKNETSKNEKEEEKTFSRDEVNKMINAEKLKERQAVIKEFETKKQEAEKLAKMDEDQKKNYELQQWKVRAEKAEKENAVRELESETIKQANEKGIPLEFITFNFEHETAETIATKLEQLQKAVKRQRERVVEEYTKEEPPQTGDKVDTKPKSGYEKFLEKQK